MEENDDLIYNILVWFLICLICVILVALTYVTFGGIGK